MWGYNQNLETHTVETHIYRLRKKIINYFNDFNFLKKNKDGYLL
ncbi:helix-turn-helix domain-containing protein [Candidatus Pelagibacter sp.]|nr:helix-turn-helix domain-containing protein [Candidatus Pelagibacter sp.]